MTTTTVTRSTSRRFARLAAALSALAAVSVLAVSSAGAASAHEAREHLAGTQSTAYSEPQPALGGRSLAEYVAEHQARVLGPIGV
jgi:hypothetical protein